LGQVRIGQIRLAIKYLLVSLRGRRSWGVGWVRLRKVSNEILLVGEGLRGEVIL